MEENLGNSKSGSILAEKTMLFSIRIVKLAKHLVEEKKEFIISKQVTRSGTNPGAMIREAINAESDLDFIHKLGIAQKEIGETQYWLELLWKTENITDTQYVSLCNDAEEIMKMVRSSILTKKKNMKK